MMADSKYNGMAMEEIHAHVLRMLKEIHSICEKSSINYFMQGGTLLGSVREKGFIPWDDDADLMLYRDEFDRLESCLNNQKAALEEKGFIFQYTDRVPKLCLIENPYVHVDFFIIDCLPRGILQKKCKLLVLKILQGMVKEDVDYSNYSLLGKILVYGTSTLGRIFNDKQKLELYKKMSIYGNGSKPEIEFWSNDLYRFIHYEFEKDYFRETELMPFEDTELYAPKRWNIYLLINYGDNFMEPVKENFFTFKNNWKD